MYDWERLWGQHPQRPVLWDTGAAADAQVLRRRRRTRPARCPLRPLPQTPQTPFAEVSGSSVDPVSKQVTWRQVPVPLFWSLYFLLFEGGSKRVSYCSHKCSTLEVLFSESLSFFLFLSGGFSNVSLSTLKYITHTTHLKVNKKSDLKSCV